MTNIKKINLITRPGLNILAPVQCNQCRHLFARPGKELICSIWAFPEWKWRDQAGCPNYELRVEPSQESGVYTVKS